MHKRIISIILVIVFVFSMSAFYEKNDSIPDNVIKEEAQIEATETINPWDIEDCLEFIYFEDVEAMTLEEVNALAENLVHMSKTANLSPWDMYEMGDMFNFIWDYPNYDKAKFKKEFCEAFDNVYNHATEIGSTLDILEPWIQTPVAEVMSKYLSSSNFEKPVELWSRVINELSEEDLAIVAKAFVNNPTMAVNADIARSIICATDNEETSKMAWEHLLRLSSSDVMATLKPFYSGSVCWDIFTNQDLVYDEEIIIERVYNTEYITQVAKNILTNPSFDFVKKYSFFCSDFFVGSDVDVEISQMAMDYIHEILSNPTIEECTLVAKALYEAGYELEEISEPLHEQYVTMLVYCLVKITS